MSHPSTPATVRRYLLKTAILAALYMVTGKIGLLLALPPGYATVIWPPSGIAIGMLIVYGWRLWPGILVGSFLLNCYISGAYDFAGGLPVEKLLAALGIAVGSTLQALAGWVLVRRVFGIPLRLSHIREMVWLFVLCGPLACLIAATAGVGSLYATHVITAGQVLGNWVTWWMGDMFGVLVFLPLVLVAPGSGGRLTWRGNALGSLPIVAMLVLVMPLGLTFYAWKLASENIHAQHEAEFGALAQGSELALRYRLDSYEHALLGGVAYFQGSEFVSHAEWKSYVDTMNIRAHFPGISGIGYIAAVAEGTVPAYAKKAGKERSGAFTVHPTLPQGPHYVINYIEPEATNKEAVGLDIAFEARRREAAELSRDSGAPAITKKIVLVQDAQKTPGFLLLHPMYEKSMPAAHVDDRRAALKGWIYAPFVAKNFLHALTKSQGDLLNVRIYDGREEIADNLIYSSGGDSLRGQHAFTVRRHLSIMQQDWLVIWTSTPEFERSQRTDEPLFVMVGGLLFTGLFGLFLMVVAVKRTETMEWMVKERGYVLPMMIFCVTAAGAFYLYQTLNVREEQFVQGIVSQQAEKIRLLIETETSSKLLALKRMALRWDAANGTPRDQWRKDSDNYVGHLGGLRTLEWIDSSYHVRWAEPLAGNEKAIGLNIVFNEERRLALEGAAERETMTLTPPLDLVQGYRAFIAYAPVHRRDKFDGFIAGIFATNDFFREVLPPDIESNFSVAILHDGKRFFENKLSDEAMAEELAKYSKLQVYDKEWSIELVPSRHFVQSNLTSLPKTILAAGLLIALLLALTVRTILIARIRAVHLAESNKLNNAIMSGAASLIIATDRKGVVVAFNRAAEIALGYEAREIVGKQTPALWHDEAEVVRRAEQLSDELNTHVEPGFEVFVAKPRLDGIEVREWSFIRKNGTRFYGNLTATTLQDINGKITGYLGVIDDVTERKRAVEALKTSEETFRSAMESASIGMALVKPDGRWMKVNPALCQLLGYSEDELLSNDFQSISHPDDLARDLQYVKQVLDSEISSYQMEKRYYHKGGRVIWALLSVSLVRDGEGVPNYFIAQIQDITEQKEMERMKSEFISIVSHELRTPLTSIRGSLGLILGAMAKDLPEKVKGLIGIAHSNCERLILLINDILDIDKIASGQMRFDVREESLAEIVRQAVDANHGYAEKFNTSIAVTPIDESLRVDVDVARFIQVMSNLLSNAIKFSPPQTPVEVTAQVIAGMVRLSVSDHGPGIPEEFRSRIFGKFSQADSSVTRSKGGTGLGLHISKQMIEQMQGHIGFDTETGAGTTFWIELPLIVENAAEGETDEPDDGRLRILICEDDRAVTTLFIVMLTQAGFRVDSAGRLAEARRLLKEHRYDAMTLDSSLPDGSGAAFLKELRAHPATESLPVVMVSGRDASEVEISIAKNAVSVWLHKPVHEAELVDAVRKATGGLPTILHIEDDTDLTNVLATALQGKAGVIGANTLRQAEICLRQRIFDLIILDIGMPDGSGLTMIEKMEEMTGRSTPIMILSADLPSREVQDQVLLAMEKSRVSETKIVQTILDILNHSKTTHGE